MFWCLTESYLKYIEIPGSNRWGVDIEILNILKGGVVGVEGSVCNWVGDNVLSVHIGNSLGPDGI